MHSMYCGAVDVALENRSDRGLIGEGWDSPEVQAEAQGYVDGGDSECTCVGDLR